MAHFAELDENNVVKQVIVVHNNELLDENGVESEQKGIDFCTNLLGGTWIQTSYNMSFRGVFASKGYIYDPTNDVFIQVVDQEVTEGTNEESINSNTIL